MVRSNREPPDSVAQALRAAYLSGRLAVAFDRPPRGKRWRRQGEADAPPTGPKAREDGWHH